MNQTGSKPNQPKKVDPSQSFEGIDSIFGDLAQSLKSDLAEGMAKDAAYQAKLSKKSPLEQGQEQKPDSQRIDSAMSQVFGEQLLVDLGIERKRKESEEKMAADAQEITHLSEQIKLVSEKEESRTEGAVQQLVETQIEIAKEENFSTTTAVEQRPQKVGIGHLILERLKLKWLRVKIDRSKTWMDASQGKKERTATGMMVFVKGKQMQGLEQQVWQHQG